MYRFFRVTLPAYRAVLSSSTRGFSTIVGTPKTRNALIPSSIEGQSLLYRLNTTSPSYAASLGPVRTFFWRKKKGAEDAEAQEQKDAGKQEKNTQQSQTTTTQSSESTPQTSAADSSDKFQTLTRTGVTVLTKPATRSKVSFDKRQVKQQKMDLQKNAIKQRRIDNLEKKKAAEAAASIIPPAPTPYVNPNPSPSGYVPVPTITSIEQAENQLEAWYQTTGNTSGRKMFPFNPYPLKRLIALSHARVAETDNKEEIETIAKNVDQWVKKLLYTRAVTLEAAVVSPLLDFFCDKTVGQIDTAVDFVRSSVLNPKKVVIVTHPRQRALEGGKKIVRVKGVLMKAADAEKELPEQANLEVKPYLRLFPSVSTMERVIGALFASGQPDTALELFVDFFDTPITLETEGEKKPKNKNEFALKPTKETYAKLCRSLANLSPEPRYYELFKLSAEQFLDLTQNDKKTQLRTASSLIDGSLRSKDFQNLEGYLQKITQDILSTSKSVSVLKMNAAAFIALGKTDEAGKAISQCPKEVRSDLVKSLVQYVAFLDGLAPPAGAEAGEKLLDQTKAFIASLVSSNPDLSLPEPSQIDSWVTTSQ